MESHRSSFYEDLDFEQFLNSQNNFVQTHHQNMSFVNGFQYPNSKWDYNSSKASKKLFVKDQ